MLAKSYHFGVNWPTTFCENEDGVHFFTLNFECHNRHNKLLLCNFKDGDIAWCNVNNTEWGFCVFFITKTCFLKKTTKKTDWKNKKTLVGSFCFRKKRVFLNPDYLSIFLWFSFDHTIWNKSHHYQFDWVCAAHLQYRSLAFKKLRITGIWIRKI